MAIRLRQVNERWIAVCAACTTAKMGDVYIDDPQHEALADKFSRDFNDMFDCGLPFDLDAAELVEKEESNNSAREWWVQTYGNSGQTLPAGHREIYNTND